MLYLNHYGQKHVWIKVLTFQHTNTLMKRVFALSLVLTGLFSQEYGYAQKKESYKSVKSRSAQSNIPALLKEADAVKNSDPTRALDQVQEALGQSLARGDVFNEGKSYVLLGEINEGIQEWKLAQENYQTAYQKLSPAYSSSPEYQHALRGLGYTNLKLADYTASLRYYQEALALAPSESQKNNLRLALSETHYQMENYEEALSILNTIPLRKISNSSFESQIQNQKAKIYAKLNELDKTKDYYQNSLNTLRSNKNADPQGAQALQKNKDEITDVLREQKRYDDEIDIRNQTIEYNLESNNLSEVTKDKVAIGRTLEAKGENSAALRELEEAALLADSLNDPKEQAFAYLALADLYEKNGRSTQALNTYKKYSKAVNEAEALNKTQLVKKEELIKKQRDIEELSKDVSIGKREEEIQDAIVFRQQLVIYGLVFIALMLGITSYFIYKSAQASKAANQLLALKSLRSQMNPHFIFNALNSVNHFIAQQDERTANKFLSEFSQLMRLVLENSQEDFIPLHKEYEILSLYLKLEHYRFRDKFEYELELDSTINTETVEVPPMLIQPYIENAVWHGLRYKESKGKLSLRLYKEQTMLIVEITDDGIGRKRSAELKTENQKKHTSTGIRNIQERLAIINKVYKTNYRVSIMDLDGGTGTRVRIEMPVTNAQHRL